MPQGSNDYPLTKLLGLDITKTLDEVQQFASFHSDRSISQKILKVVDFYREAMKEIDDYGNFLDNAGKVYDHVTGGLISKPNTSASSVIGAADEHRGECFEDWMDTELEDKAVLTAVEAGVVMDALDGYREDQINTEVLREAREKLDAVAVEVETKQ
jgi:hypothetical protein